MADELGEFTCSHDDCKGRLFNSKDELRLHERRHKFSLSSSSIFSPVIDNGLILEKSPKIYGLTDVTPTSAKIYEGISMNPFSESFNAAAKGLPLNHLSSESLNTPIILGDWQSAKDHVKADIVPAGSESGVLSQVPVPAANKGLTLSPSKDQHTFMLRNRVPASHGKSPLALLSDTASTVSKIEETCKMVTKVKAVSRPKVTLPTHRVEDSLNTPAVLDIVVDMESDPSVPPLTQSVTESLNSDTVMHNIVPDEALPTTMENLSPPQVLPDQPSMPTSTTIVPTIVSPNSSKSVLGVSDVNFVLLQQPNGQKLILQRDQSTSSSTSSGDSAPILSASVLPLDNELAKARIVSKNGARALVLNPSPRLSSKLPSSPHFQDFRLLEIKTEESNGQSASLQVKNSSSSSSSRNSRKRTSFGKLKTPRLSASGTDSFLESCNSSFSDSMESSLNRSLDDDVFNGPQLREELPSVKNEIPLKSKRTKDDPEESKARNRAAVARFREKKKKQEKETMEENERLKEQINQLKRELKRKDDMIEEFKRHSCDCKITKH